MHVWPEKVLTLEIFDVLFVNFVLNAHVGFTNWRPDFHMKRSAGQPKYVFLQHIWFSASYFNFFAFSGTTTRISLFRNNSKRSKVEIPWAIRIYNDDLQKYQLGNKSHWWVKQLQFEKIQPCRQLWGQVPQDLLLFPAHFCFWESNCFQQMKIHHDVFLVMLRCTFWRQVDGHQLLTSSLVLTQQFSALHLSHSWQLLQAKLIPLNLKMMIS